jgi:hypothetical protein
MAILNYFDFFIASELDEGVGSSMNFNVDVRDMLCMMQTNPILFKILTNFILKVFKKLALFVVLIIISNTRFTNEVHIIARCFIKIQCEATPFRVYPIHET